MSETDLSGHDYSMTVQWSDEDEGYIALSPEWPGLSAFGTTRQEAITEAEIALDGMWTVAVGYAMDLPTPRILEAKAGKRP